MQSNCIFPGRYAPLTYYDWLRGRPRNTLMARIYIISLVKCNFNHPFLKSLVTFYQSDFYFKSRSVILSSSSRVLVLPPRKVMLFYLYEVVIRHY